MSHDRAKFRKMHAKLASAGRQITRFFVRVEYGYNKNVYGKKIMFHNEYIGDNLAEAKLALSAFLKL